MQVLAITKAAKTMPVTTRAVPTPIGDADAIEIQCTFDEQIGGMCFHADVDVTLAVGMQSVVMTSEAAKAFIAALSERVNRD